jgi:hypothetical protein
MRAARRLRNAKSVVNLNGADAHRAPRPIEEMPRTKAIFALRRAGILRHAHVI